MASPALPSLSSVYNPSMFMPGGPLSQQMRFKPGAAGATPTPTPAGAPAAAPASSPYLATSFPGFNGSGGTSGVQQNLGNSADSAAGSEVQLANESQGILGDLSGPPQDSPLYTSLLNSSRAQINNSYDQAIQNTRASAASRGFGYQDPMEQGAEAGTRSEEAGALAAAPSTALQETIAPELQAAGIEANEAGMFAGQEESDLGDVSALQSSRNSKDASLINSFTTLYGNLAKAVSGGQ